MQCYYSEMGQSRPVDAVIDARLGHYGKHYFLDTPLVLSGRGVELLKTYKPQDFVDPSNRKVGWHQYKVTIKAMERIESQHKVACELLLD